MDAVQRHGVTSGIDTALFRHCTPAGMAGLRMYYSQKLFFSQNIKEGLPYLFHSFRNKYFYKISLGNMLYFQNKL